MEFGTFQLRFAKVQPGNAKVGQENGKSQQENAISQQGNAKVGQGNAISQQGNAKSQQGNGKSQQGIAISLPNFGKYLHGTAIFLCGNGNSNLRNRRDSQWCSYGFEVYCCNVMGEYENLLN